MNNILGVKAFCRFYYELDESAEPTHSQLNVIQKMCREGKFKNAFKIGRKWFIDLGSEIEHANK